MKPTLLVLGHSSALSGAELNLLRTLPGLSAFRVEVILAEQGPLVAALERQQVPVEVCPIADSALQWRASGKAGALRRVWAALGLMIYACQLSVRICRKRPDIIYTNSAKAHVYGNLVGKIIRRPVVSHLHDRLTRDLMSNFNLALMKLVTQRLAAGIVANSNSTLGTATLGEQPCAVIPCALQGDIPRRQPSICTGVRFVLTGRISPWKGQSLAISAFAKALTELPAGSTLDIVGEALFGESAYKQSLVSMVDELGLKDCVKFRGHVTDAPNELQLYDVLIHSSVVPEPFGQVITEGMAAGLPVIAAAAGGPAEIITDGHDGVLYPMADADGLTEAMVRLGSSAELRSRLGNNGMSTAEKYSAAVVVPELQEFLRIIASKNDREIE